LVPPDGDDHHLHDMLPEVVGSKPDKPEMINLAESEDDEFGTAVPAMEPVQETSIAPTTTSAVGLTMDQEPVPDASRMNAEVRVRRRS
jgi:hypothetical protein